MAKEQLETCKREREEYLNGWKRAKADFINYRREENERLRRAYERGEAELMNGLLDVLDSFDQSLRGKDGHVGKEGVLLIRKQLTALLKSHNVRELAPERGEPFNPELHEALAVVADEGTAEGETIVETMRAGYAHGDKVLRPAQVVVAKGKEKGDTSAPQAQSTSG